MTARTLPVRVLLAGLVTVLGVAGCGSNPAPGDAAPDLKIPDVPAQNVRQEVLGLQEAQPLLFQAEEELVRQCMSRAGRKYVKAATSASAGFADDYSRSSDDAQRYGYQPPGRAASAPDDPNSSPAVMGATETARRAWGEAFFGRDAGDQVVVEVPGVGTLTTNPTGCVSESRIALYGTLEQYLLISGFANNLKSAFAARAANDDGVKDADRDWSKCMEVKGYSELASPDEAAAAGREMSAASTSRPSPAEVRLAVADDACVRSVDYVQRRHYVEDRYYTAAFDYYEGQVTAVQEQYRAASTRAKEVLGGSAS